MPTYMRTFSRTARLTLSRAMAIAVQTDAEAVEGCHVLGALATLPPADSVAGHVLEALGIADDLRPATAVPDQTDPLDTRSVDLNQDVLTVLEQAATRAQQRNDATLAAAHLLWGCLHVPAVASLLPDADRQAIKTALNSLDVWTDDA